MTNRLLQLKQGIGFSLLAGFWLLTGTHAFAQQSFFNFTPPANTTIPANPCAASVSQLAALPTVTSTVGATITVSMFDPVASGYQFTDLWPAPFNNLIVHWKVADNMGHTADFIFTVNIVDVTPPVFNTAGVPPTNTYPSVVQVPTLAALPVTDNCQPPYTVSQTFTQTTPPDTCLAGTFTRTWTATDAAGNTAVYTQVITILQDNTPPAIQNFPVSGGSTCAQLSTAYPAWLAAQMANFSATDASGIKSYTNNAPSSYPPGCKAPIQVTFWATDNCMIANPVTVTYVTSDPNLPYTVVPPKDSVAYCTSSGAPLAALGEWIAKRGYSVAKDSCTEDHLLTYDMEMSNQVVDSAQVVAAMLASYSTGCLGQTIGSNFYPKVRGKVRVAFFTKDACGNRGLTGIAEFGIIDTLRPVITGVGTVEQCGGNDNLALQNWINAHGNAALSDACSSASWFDFSWTSSDGQSGNGTFGTGPYPQVKAHDCQWWADVTFRAKDDCGNIASIKLRFQVQDSEKPVISGFPPVITLPCTSPNPTLSPAFVSDNCDTSLVITYTAVNSDSTCGGSYNRTVTWQATDDCGNTGTAVQLVQVRDTTGPVFTLVPGTLTLYCDTFALPAAPVAGVTIKATDACSTVASITTQTTSFQDPDPAVCGHYNYTILRTFTARDACNNTSTATQTIQVTDNQGPVFSGYLDTTGVCNVTPIMPPPTASDACSGMTAAPTLQSQTTTPGICPNSYTINLQWVATDVCNNPSTFTQHILLLDTVAPVLTGVPADVTVECTNIPPPPPSGGVAGTDNCAANVGINLVENTIRNPNTADCDHWTNYLIRREWTATDLCGNSRKYTQNIYVRDVTGPVMTAPQSQVLPADPGVCAADLVLPPPLSLYDMCTAVQPTITLTGTRPLVTTTGGNPLTTPVDTVVFQWNIPNPPPQTPLTSNASLTIVLQNADANDPTEFFRIFGEQGFPIGITTLTSTPCGSNTQVYTINLNQMNTWLADGILTLKMATNGTGGGAINPVCPGGQVQATLSYTVAQAQIPIDLNYSIDNGPQQNYPPAGPIVLSSGTHTVVYTATDCAGNSSTVSSTIEIQDLQPPVITAPAPVTAFVANNNCLATVNLPFPNIFENCAVAGSLTLSSALLPVTFENTDAGIVPGDINLQINGLIANAVGPGTLKIRHRGDNAQSGEFFNVFDENNVPLGQTTPNTGGTECTGFHESDFTVSASAINTWAQTGSNAGFRLESNQDILSFTDFINPCGPLTGNTDGISQVQAMLEYHFATVGYQITNNANGLTVVPPGTLNSNQTTVNLPPGNYTVQYSVTDNSGLTGTASFQVVVRDTIKPVANCLPTTILTNPSGLPADVFMLQPAVINNNSTDNCSGPLSYQLSQTNFNCNMATPPNNIYPVTLTVTDASGNSASCTANVRVEIKPLAPYYLPVCEGDTLKLFADLNLPDPNNIYTFVWKNPANAQFALSRNTQIPNVQISNEGIYTVTATGSSGCTTSGTVNVVLFKLPGVPLLETNSSVCFGDSIYLSTPSFNGSNVFYLWYSVAPNGTATFMAQTQVPYYVIQQPAVGNYQFYVKVSGGGCSSVNSLISTVAVKPKPVAMVQNATISVCQGETISLASTSTGVSSYSWMGPNGYVSNLQNPPVIQPANLIHDGQYKLEVFLNGCKSDPVFVDVDVRVKPATPGISGPTQLCAGASATLTATGVPMASSYLWTNGNQVIGNAVNNTLTLNNLTPADNGCWRVLAIQNGCLSDWSATLCIDIQPFPDVVAPASITVCAYDTLKLNATSNLAIASWSWTGPGGFTSFDKSPVRFPAIAGQYKVSGQTSNGCADTALVQVVVPPLPVIDNISNDAPLCPDGTTDATLVAVISNASPGLMYNWYFPDLSTLFSTDVSPVIPDVAASNNGTYTLIVKDVNGCLSQPNSTVISVGNPLPVPALRVNNLPTDTVCQGSTVVLSVQNFAVYANPASYTWTLPNNTMTTTMVPTLTLTNVSPNQSGLYKVQVSSANCLSPVSGSVYLKVNPIPATPVPQSNSPVCFGETLMLWVDPQSSDPNAQYFWTGPNGYTFNVPGPMVSPANETYSGSWTVKLTIKGCTSNAVEPISVVVKPKPKIPQMLPPVSTKICRETPDAKIQLQINPSTLTPGAKYTWIYLGDTLSGPNNSSGYMSNGLSQFQPGPNVFRVIAHLDGCNSVLSDPITITIDTIPNNMANAGPDAVVCISQMLRLKAEQPAFGTGLWTKLGSAPGTITNPTDHQSAVDDVVPNNTYQFVWTLSNGACTNYDADTVQIKTVAPDTALVIDPLKYACAVDELQISALQGKYGNGYWTQDANQANQLMIGIETPDSTTTWVNNLVPGATYFFYWNLPDIGCGASIDTVVIRNYSAKPFAGNDRTLCVTDPCANLNATMLQNFESGTWSALTPGVTFGNAGSNATSVCNLAPGQNTLIWTTNGGVCGSKSRDTIVINFQLYPTAYADTINVGYGQNVPFNVLFNDTYPNNGNITVDIVNPVPIGVLGATPTLGGYTYQASNGFTGTTTMVYRICNLLCPEPACSANNVVFEVGEPGGCLPPTIITPNNDDVNDTFIVPISCAGADGFQAIQVTIFNQWGDQVFHSESYDNSRAWDGTFNGQPLPTGTYFFHIRLSDTEKPLVGFVLIQR
jgi:gliding motility-associated-like protein